jgi:hypothetical protein
VAGAAIGCFAIFKIVRKFNDGRAKRPPDAPDARHVPHADVRRRPSDSSTLRSTSRAAATPAWA